MNYKKLTFVLLIFTIIISLNFVSAAENSSINENILNEVDNGLIDENLLSDSQENVITESESDILSSEDYNIYVGTPTSGDGEGTLDNPYESFEVASNAITDGNNVTIHVLEGTYTLDSKVVFDAKTLNIIGEGNVVIDSVEMDDDILWDEYEGFHQAFFWVNDESTTVFSNINFDASKFKYSEFYDIDDEQNCCFYPCLGKYVTFNNCSFTGFNSLYNGYIARLSEGYEYLFISSTFSNNLYDYGLFEIVSDGPCKLTLEYCNYINNVKLYSELLSCSISLDGIWFGRNTPSYTDNLSKYAIFSVIENYLGNNQFEIIGNLTWNDGTTDGIENLGIKTVTLSSDTGNIATTATLDNGVFKAIYTSNNEDNTVTATLDKQEQTLNFKNIEIDVTGGEFEIGQSQQVTIALPSEMTATLIVNVNNKNTTVEFNNEKEKVYTLSESLSKGTYPVTVSYIDKENHVYGSGTADLTVKQLSAYTFNADIPSEANFGQYTTIAVELPSDATGTVTVEAGNAKQTKDAAEKLSFDFGFNAGSYPVTVTYSGDDKYSAPEAVTGTITVKQAQSGLYMNDLSVEYAESITIPYTGNSIVGINAVLLKDSVEIGTYKSTDGNIVLGNLAVGSYVIEASSIVTSNFLPSSAKINLNVTKAASTININDATFNYGEDITLTADTTNSVGDIAASVVDANNKAVPCNVSGNTIKLSGLDAGVYTVSVSTNVDANHNAATKTATLTVKKVEIPVSDNTVNVDVPAGTTSPSFDISLPADATGKLTVTVNGKEYTSDLVNGKATVNVNDLPAGDYAATVAYSGDAKYDPITKTTSISIPKAVLTGKDVTMLYTSGAKYTVTLTRAGVPLAGENVTIKVNGVESVIATDDNGSASVVLALNPSAKAYKVTATYGDVTVSNNVVVKSIVTAKNVKVKKTAKSLKIKVTLKKVNGKYLNKQKVTLKVKGKTLTKYTTSKGVATFTIGKKILNTFKAGKNYTYKVTYGKDTASKKITVVKK